MAEKCDWCAKAAAELKQIQLPFRHKSEEAKTCGEPCEKELRKFIEYADGHIMHYFIGLILSILSGLIITFWRIKIDYGALGVLIIFAGSGVTLMKYPFVTHRTITLLGAKKAIASGRIIGAVSIVFGIAFWFVLATILPRP
ncbi:MAG: hypothetical protein HKM93_16070 [Desulfobacteraceae bacterium]|nr:hypothetical protein [Desulfobacteraceae bacterium]